MFQDFALFPHLSNLANVMFGLKSLPKADAEREARLALERVGLADYANLYPHMLSGGEQQRVALARAVAPRPSVLLMDEPFSGLDRRLRDQVREDVLHVLRESRVTCVIVTHDAEEAMRMADRIALMRAGRLVQVERAGRDLSRARRPVRGALLLRAQRGAGSRARPRRRDSRSAGSPRRISPKAAPPSWRSARRAFAASGRFRHCRDGLTSRRFLGEIELLELAVNGVEEPLLARVRERVYPPPRQRGRDRDRPGRSPCFCRARSLGSAPKMTGRASPSLEGWLWVP